MDKIKDKKILVVDDDQVITKMYRRKFVEAGFEVAVANDGDEALSNLKNNFNPDVILLDLIMPNMTGHDLLKIIREQKLATGAKIVILSNQNEEKDISLAKSLGIDGYIVKATTLPSEIVSEILKIIGQ